MEASPDNEIRAALDWALLDDLSVWRLRPKVSSFHRREMRMGLNGKGHLGISGQIPYSSRMEQTKGEGAGKGPGRQRGHSCPLSHLEALWKNKALQSLRTDLNPRKHQLVSHMLSLENRCWLASPSLRQHR